jgi:integrase
MCSTLGYHQTSKRSYWRTYPTRRFAIWWRKCRQQGFRQKPSNYVQVVKLVVASAVNDEGEQIYPRTWNHDFIQLPMVRKDKQYRPTVTDAELAAILSNTKKRKHVMLFSLLAATGLRVGEALALRSTDFGPDCRVVYVRRSVWRGNEQEPKRQTRCESWTFPKYLRANFGSTSAASTG